MLSQTQKSIADFGVYEVKSATTDRMFEVKVDKNGNYSCDKDCKHWSTHHTACRHILEHILTVNQQKMFYLENRSSEESRALFQTFDQVVAFFDSSQDMESRYIDGLIMSFAFKDDKVWADPVYEMIGGKFMKSPNKMGARFRSLHQRGFIEKIGWTTSQRDNANGNPQRVWKLTDKGKKMFIEGY